MVNVSTNIFKLMRKIYKCFSAECPFVTSCPTKGEGGAAIVATVFFSFLYLEITK